MVDATSLDNTLRAMGSQEGRLDITKTITERGTLKVKLDRYIDNQAQIMRDYNVPAGAKVEIEIPGGGDWSGCRVDASDLDAVVTWETTQYVD